MKLGTHPLKIQKNPSLLAASFSVSTIPNFSPADMIRVLITSTGEQTVVATKPAARDDVKCVTRLSDMWNVFRQICLKAS